MTISRDFYKIPTNLDFPNSLSHSVSCHTMDPATRTVKKPATKRYKMIDLAVLIGMVLILLAFYFHTESNLRLCEH